MGAICASEPPFVKGTYTLVIESKRAMRVRFGRLGSARLTTGYYVYTGSALGQGALSLERRLGRHIRRSKRAHWHVDYLTTRDEYVVRAGVCVKSGRRLECLVNRRIHRAVDVRVVLPHLGATDCTCVSHLVKVDSSLKTILARVNKIYCEFGDPFTFHVNRGARFSGLLPIFSGTRP